MVVQIDEWIGGGFGVIGCFGGGFFSLPSEGVVEKEGEGRKTQCFLVRGWKCIRFFSFLSSCCPSSLYILFFFFFPFQYYFIFLPAERLGRSFKIDVMVALVDDEEGCVRLFFPLFFFSFLPPPFPAPLPPPIFFLS